MYADELLQAPHSSEPEHSPFSPSEREVRVFSPVVLVATDLLAVFVADFVHGCAIRRTAISYDDLRIAISFHRFLQEFQCSSLVTLLGHERFQNFAFMID